MEIVLCLFLGIWISVAGVCAYFWIKNEMSSYLNNEKNKVNTTK